MIPVIDGHNDLAWEALLNRNLSIEDVDKEARQTLHTDLPKLRRGGVGGQFWSIYLPPEYVGEGIVKNTLLQIDFIYRLVAKYPNDFELAYTADAIKKAMSSGKIASLLGVEGAHHIDGSMAVLRQFARLGMRYMTLTWNNTNEFADAGLGEHIHGGLSQRGKDMVHIMNEIGVIVDLSHTSFDTMRDSLAVTDKPIMFSHSSSYQIHQFVRNVPEDVQHLLVENDGIQMISFAPNFLSATRRAWSLVKGKDPENAGSAPEVTIDDVVTHIEAAREVVGVDHLGLGGDFDGVEYGMPTGLSDVSYYQDLLAKLSDRGWTIDELEKLAYKNVLRVIEKNDEAYEAFVLD
jgi:membrane dipeptidase